MVIDTNLPHPTTKKTVFCLVFRVLVQSVATISIKFVVKSTLIRLSSRLPSSTTGAARGALPTLPSAHPRAATAAVLRRRTRENASSVAHRPRAAERRVAARPRREMRGKTTSLVDVAFRATSLGLFTVTVVSGAWFLATTAKGFTHYSAQHEAMKRREVEAEARKR